jgi:hypothetical protein
VELAAVGELFGSFDAPWWIAGGWAIDLFVGRPTRAHDDVDVVVLRRDQDKLRAHFVAWDVQVVTQPGALQAWSGERLELPIHELWARPTPSEAWACEVLLDEVTGERWTFRRDPRVKLPLTDLGAERDGLPAVVPEVVLLFKSKAPGPKDEADFDVVLPLLAPHARRWLANALGTAYPGHEWLERLA